MAETRMGIIGLGKIARDQHVPAIAGNPAFRLVAAVAPSGAPGATVPLFADHRTMLREVEVDAVAICTPAGPRYGIARDCLEAGRHVLLEKPPTTTLGELAELEAFAGRCGHVLFTTWHAQYNPAVDRLRALFAEEGLGSLAVEWFEDVEKWHPGQQWIWAPGGFGVFDAGINALSILAAISPSTLIVDEASFVSHSDQQQPIAARLALSAPGSAGPLTVTLDWRHKGDEHWTMSGTTTAGTRFALSAGGASLRIGDGDTFSCDRTEYPAIYARFADLLRGSRSLVEREPLRLLADAFLIAGRVAELPAIAT